jgi:DNA-binding NarL/FixJ family response regulator
MAVRVSGETRVRLVLADDNPSSLQTLTTILSRRFDIIAAVTDGISAFHSIVDLSPDVAVLDLEMPGMNGIEVTRELRKQCCNLGIVICSVHNDIQVIKAAAEVGASGYVLKVGGFSDLEAAILTVAQGGRFFPHAVVSDLS